MWGAALSCPGGTGEGSGHRSVGWPTGGWWEELCLPPMLRYLLFPIPSATTAVICDVGGWGYGVGSHAEHVWGRVSVLSLPSSSSH